MNTPTCEDLRNEELGYPIQVDDDTSWRHGFYRTAIYKRELDNTYWQATYAVSTDGETNGLREGEADIVQVWPQEVTVTKYVTNKP